MLNSNILGTWIDHGWSVLSTIGNLDIGHIYVANVRFLSEHHRKTQNTLSDKVRQMSDKF